MIARQPVHDLADQSRTTAPDLRVRMKQQRSQGEQQFRVPAMELEVLVQRDADQDPVVVFQQAVQQVPDHVLVTRVLNLDQPSHRTDNPLGALYRHLAGSTNTAHERERRSR